MDMQHELGATEIFSVEIDTRLRDAFARHEQREEDNDVMMAAMNAMCTEAHFRKMSPAAVVIAMHRTWDLIPRPDSVTQLHWSRSYYAALGMCLSTFLGAKK